MLVSLKEHQLDPTRKKKKSRLDPITSLLEFEELSRGRKEGEKRAAGWKRGGGEGKRGVFLHLSGRVASEQSRRQGVPAGEGPQDFFQVWSDGGSLPPTLAHFFFAIKTFFCENFRRPVANPGGSGAILQKQLCLPSPPPLSNNWAPMAPSLATLRQNWALLNAT